MKKSILLLSITAVILLFYNISARDLWNPDEPREAELVREMYVNNNYIIPKLNNSAFLEKPPLYYWFSIAVTKITGNLNELSLRIPSVIFGFLIVMFTFFFTKNLFNRRTAFYSAFILLLMPSFIFYARRAMLDMTLTFFLVTAFFSLYFVYKNPNKLNLFLFYSSMSLASLTKGFLGIALLSFCFFLL